MMVVVALEVGMITLLLTETSIFMFIEKDVVDRRMEDILIKMQGHI